MAQHAESLSNVLEEISEALEGDDWGSLELLTEQAKTVAMGIMNAVRNGELDSGVAQDLLQDLQAALDEVSSQAEDARTASAKAISDSQKTGKAASAYARISSGPSKV